MHKSPFNVWHGVANQIGQKIGLTVLLLDWNTLCVSVLSYSYTEIYRETCPLF